MSGAPAREPEVQALLVEFDRLCCALATARTCHPDVRRDVVAKCLGAFADLAPQVAALARNPR